MSSGDFDWLYLSRRLDLAWLPDRPFYAMSVIILGDRPHYRLTPGVVAWVERMGVVVQERVRAGQLGPDQESEYITALQAVWAFADAFLDAAEVRAARAAAAPLPAVPWVPGAVLERVVVTGTITVPAVHTPASVRPAAPPPPPAPNKRPRAKPKRASGEKFAADAGGLFAVGMAPAEDPG